MTTPFSVNETVSYCPQCGSVFFSEALRRIVPKGCNFAWDVIVFVGRSVFERYQSVDQIRKALMDRNITISASQVDYLSQKFVTYLAVAHRQAAPRINHTMQRAGGYMLHLDATHEADAPALMTGLDSLSEFVLANVKMPSEHADYIVPFLQKLRSDYGKPICCVHDMGTGICKAVEEVFADCRDFICHFHFLRDVGKDLIEPSYRQLRSCLRSHAATTKLNELIRQVRQHLAEQSIDAKRLASAIKANESAENMGLLPLVSTYSLTLWCLRGKTAGDGYGFPFDRPLLEFANRLLVLIDHLPELVQLVPAQNREGNQLFYKFVRKVVDIGEDALFHQTVEEIRWRCRLFDELRQKMRIALPGGLNGLNDEGNSEEMGSIQKAVEKFRLRLSTNRQFTEDALCQKMAKQIDKYADKLFADPIEISSPSGTMTIYPQRTNNILEQFFRDMRRGHRRKTGNNSMRKRLQAMLADTPLVKNLGNAKYMEILLNGKSKLEDLFAEIEMTQDRMCLKTEPETEKILPGFQSLASMPMLPAQIVKLAISAQEMPKSN